VAPDVREEHPEGTLNIRAMLTGSIKRLAHVYRFSSLPVIRRENVAEHTCFVSIFCLLIGKDLEQRGWNVDYEKLLKNSLLHDIDESLSGDFLRCVKYGIPGLKQLLDEASHGFMKDIGDQLKIDLIPDWKDAKDESLEGSVLAVADLLGVISYVLEEFAGGNRHLLYILKEVDGYYERLEKTIQSPMMKYVRDARKLILEIHEQFANPLYPTLMEPNDVPESARNS